MLRIIVALAALSLTIPAPMAAPLSPAEQYARMCANVLNFVPRIVRKSTVAAIGGDRPIVLHSICRGVEMTDFGNAAGLTRTIAANPVLRRALARYGWRPDDVISIDPTGETVHLYVHRN
ncbi:MAG: hypothetical protein Q7T08_12260 [Devosia sp.]|nr:hypothetical protein [Devosia sp.]